MFPFCCIISEQVGKYNFPVETFHIVWWLVYLPFVAICHGMNTYWNNKLRVKDKLSIDLICLSSPLNPQESENWLWCACLFINRVVYAWLSLQKNYFIYYYSPLISIKMVQLAKAAEESRSREAASKSKVSSFLSPFLYRRLEKRP